MSALKPNHATIHAVTVVPIFAPMITPIACVSVSNPAFTKLTTITVVADEDCITDVIPKPVKTPLNGLDVIADKNPRNLSPAAFCRPELIMFIPMRNMPNAPNSVNICNIPIKNKLYFRVQSNYNYVSKMLQYGNICIKTYYVKVLIL